MPPAWSADVETWPTAGVAIAVTDLDGRVLAHHGDLTRPFPLASVTKVLTAAGVLVAAEEGSVALDTPDDEGVTLADLLAHASGLGPDGARLAPVGQRRIYSNAGYEQAAGRVEQATDFDFAEYLRVGVFEPLGMAATLLTGSPAHEATSTVADLVAFVPHVARPGTLLSAPTLERWRRPHRPSLAGILPGFGRHDPNPWGLGPEIRGSKSPHWTGAGNHPDTHGHFGQSGTFVWIDPTAGLATVCLTDEPFGPWAVTAWPALSDRILGAFAGPN